MSRELGNILLHPFPPARGPWPESSHHQCPNQTVISVSTISPKWSLQSHHSHNYMQNVLTKQRRLSSPSARGRGSFAVSSSFILRSLFSIFPLIIRVLYASSSHLCWAFVSPPVRRALWRQLVRIIPRLLEYIRIIISYLNYLIRVCGAQCSTAMWFTWNAGLDTTCGMRRAEMMATRFAQNVN